MEESKGVGLKEVPSGEVPSGEVPSGEVPSGEVPSGEVPSGDKWISCFMPRRKHDNAPKIATTATRKERLQG